MSGNSGHLATQEIGEFTRVKTQEQALRCLRFFIIAYVTKAAQTPYRASRLSADHSFFQKLQSVENSALSAAYNCTTASGFAQVTLGRQGQELPTLGHGKHGQTWPRNMDPMYV